MGEQDDGGPAFAHGNPEQGGHSGVTVRQFYKAYALMGIVARGGFGKLQPLVDGTRGGILEARAAGVLADAMLREDEERENG